MPEIWRLPKNINSGTLDQFPELDPVITKLLYNRGLTSQAAIDEFLYPDYARDIHDPMLFRDMPKAIDRILLAIKNQELITIFGDYDADGVAAAVILKTALDNLGAKVSVYLPHREKEGYGLNQKAIAELANAGTKLIITCDCGVSNTEEVELARQKGLDVIITDHHTVPEILPRALAIIHPGVKGEKYPFQFLAGGGVAFKLATALLKNCQNNFSEKWLLDLVAISTVADMVPLVGENRTLVKYGLIVLAKTKNLGLKKLLAVSALEPIKIDARAISFAIAPRINAAGRMDHANLAFYLLTAQDETEAQKLAAELNQSNLDRQSLNDSIVKAAKAKAVDLSDSLLTFYDPTWAAGLTGLVAGRLVREYARPVLVMTDVEAGHIVGSGRSIDQFNITSALQECESLLLRFGGHPQACGFSLDKKNLDQFVAQMKSIAARQLKNTQFESMLDIEMQIDFENISWEIVDILEKFKPFGQNNPEPNFMSSEVTVAACRKVGLDQKHWKLLLQKGDKKRDAIGFGLANIDLQVGQNIDLVYNLAINQWNGNREIQLIIRDIKNHNV